MERKRPPLKTGHSQIRMNENSRKFPIVMTIVGLVIGIAGLAMYFIVWNTKYSDVTYHDWRDKTERKIGIVIMVTGGFLLVLALILFSKDFLHKRKHVSHHRRTMSDLSATSVSNSENWSSRNGRQMQQITDMSAPQK